MSRAGRLASRIAALLLPMLAMGQQPGAATGSIARTLEGKPDFQGNWFRRSMYGPTGFNPQGGAPADGAFARAGGDRANQPDEKLRVIMGVPVPYLPEALAEAKWRKRNQYLDGEPRCHLAGVPRAHEQPPYPHLIIQDENYLTILYEYVHEPRIIPLDDSPHPKNYRAWDGDSRGHWAGDTLVVDVSNFNGRTWQDMVGNFVDENLHVVERYTMSDANTYLYEVTLTDPTVFSKPWTYNLTVHRQADKDQILEYGCLEGEGDLANYADVRNAELAARNDSHTIRGCLRGELGKSSAAGTQGKPGSGYKLAIGRDRQVEVIPAAAVSARLPELLDREVRLGGNWQGSAQRSFTVETATAIAEGCSAGKW